MKVLGKTVGRMLVPISNLAEFMKMIRGPSLER